MERNNKINEKNAKQSKTRRNLIIVIAVVTVLAGISWVISAHPEIFDIFSKNEKKAVTSMYSDRLYSYNFYDSDYDLDVTTVPEYMELDRAVHYKNGSVTILIPDEEMDNYNAAVRFFGEYFKTIIAGDVETYNTYFTDAYYEEYEPYVSFAPQMIYNIEIEQLRETPNDDGSTTYAFNVTYMIYRNDGTFRNDMGSDAAKKLYYELIEDRNGNVKINYITYYKRS